MMKKSVIVFIAALSLTGCKNDLGALTPSDGPLSSGITVEARTVTITSFLPIGSVTTNAAAAATTFVAAASSSSLLPIEYTWTLTDSGAVTTQVASNTTGTFSFNPALYVADTYTLTVTASDSLTTASHNWSVKINRAPTITGQSPSTATRGLSYDEVLNLSATVADADGDVFTATWTLNGAANAALVDGGVAAGTASAAFTSSATLLGANTITLTLDDGNLTATYSWTLNINYLNSACNTFSTNQVCTYVGLPGIGSAIAPTNSKVGILTITDFEFDTAGNLYIFETGPGAGSFLRVWNRSGANLTVGGTTIAPGMFSAVAGTGLAFAASTAGSVKYASGYGPRAMAVDSVTGDIYMSWYFNGGFKKVLSGATNTHTSVAITDSPTSATYANNRIYFGNDSRQIKYYDIAGNSVTTVLSGAAGYAGDGTAAGGGGIQLGAVFWLDFDSSGNLFFSDSTQCTVRVICANPITGGICSTGKIDGSNWLRLDPGTVGGAPAAGFLYTVAGQAGSCHTAGAPSADGDPVSGKIPASSRISVGTNGVILVAGTSASVILAINTTAAPVTVGGTSVPAYTMYKVINKASTPVWGGDGGHAGSTTIGTSGGLAKFDPITGNVFYMENLTELYWRTEARLRQVVNATGAVSNVVGATSYGKSAPAGITAAAATSPLTAQSVAAVEDDKIFYAESAAGQSYIRQVDKYGQVSAVNRGYIGAPAGGNSISDLGLAVPYITRDDLNNIIILDSSYNSVFYWNRGSTAVTRFGQSTSPGIVSHIAGIISGTGGYTGNGAPATAYKLSSAISAVAINDEMFIADFGNHCIRKVDNTGTISTALSAAAGCGNLGNGPNDSVATSTGINNPYAITADSSGNIIVADTNGYVRLWNRTAGQITVYGQTIDSGKVKIIMGGGADIFNNGVLGTVASISSPRGLAVDSSGDLYVSLNGTSLVRKLSRTTGFVTTVLGASSASNTGGKVSWGTDDEGVVGTAREIPIPYGISMNPAGDLFIGFNYTIHILKLKLTP